MAVVRRDNFSQSSLRSKGLPAELDYDHSPRCPDFAEPTTRQIRGRRPSLLVLGSVSSSVREIPQTLTGIDSP